jgi:hypothetical protein
MCWTCDQFERRISDYFDGAGTFAEEAAFTAHLAGCSNCTDLLWRVKDAIKHMRKRGQVEVPSRVISSILDSTIGPRLTSWQSFTKWFRGQAVLKFAYGAGSLITSCLIVLNASGTSLRKVKLEDLCRGAVYRSVDRQAHLAYAKSAKYMSDLRVVYEIKSRLQQDENQVQMKPKGSAPMTNEKQPGNNEDRRLTAPKQQNRANEVTRQPGVRVNDHSIYVRGFGKAYFAESFISRGTRTLTMLHFELGSTTGGSGSGGGGSTNGKHYPPG